MDILKEIEHMAHEEAMAYLEERVRTGKAILRRHAAGCKVCWESWYGFGIQDEHFSTSILKAVNKIRKLHDAPPVRLSDTLMRSAQAKADDMYTRNYYSHVSPDGVPPPKHVGENIAMGYTSASLVFVAWRESAGLLPLG